MGQVTKVQAVNYSVDTDVIKEMLNEKREMKEFLKICASCGLCAKSCFYYQNTGDAMSTPSYKAVNSLGLMYKKRGKVTREELYEMSKLIWGKCVLCGRCYCPLGINISSMIAWARAICRSQGVYEDYSGSSMGVNL